MTILARELFFLSCCFCLFCASVSEGTYLHIDVTRNAVSSKYIVLFKNYYSKKTRENYIAAALNRMNITSWTFGLRSNLSNLFPSDFDVVCSTMPIVPILEGHPAIKHVSFESYMMRKLHYADTWNYTTYSRSRNLLGVLPGQITDLLEARTLWDRGISGQGIKVAVFDTGLPKKHPHFRNVKELTNWTNEKSLDHSVGHGTFVAGIIGSSKDCLGIAPDVELHIYRVFTDIQVSYTSWFLDAFNYAMFKKVHVLNLSIGGPDFMDKPFVDKVLELSANKIILISAIGNSGPVYGSLNNPGDQSDVIGVGGITFDNVVAKFSSRGMTTWELPRGYGRVKPDIVTYGSNIKGSDSNGGCRLLSGTSVASPVVAGAVALILSGAREKMSLVNPASVKQILTEGAIRLKYNNIFEQGYGKLNIVESMNLMLSYVPRITLSPPYIDYTSSYMWPYSSQPLHCRSMPSIVNVTIWNGISVRGTLREKPQWHPNVEKNGDLLNLDFEYSPILWPWSGWIAVKIAVSEKGCLYEGESIGNVSFVVDSMLDGDPKQKYTLYLPVTVRIVPKPPRHKRILWDQYHNLQYPPGYIPHDNLKNKLDPLDWRGDHIHTNFQDLYHHLRSLGYYIDVLGKPFTCFNAIDYGTLLIVDPEEEFFDEEIEKLQSDVFDMGLSVIIFAEWYNTTVMQKMRFFDENTREWWTPDTGGSNVPGLNDLLTGFGLSLSDKIAEGYFNLGEQDIHYASGSTLREFPINSNNVVISARLNDQGRKIINNKKDNIELNKPEMLPIIGMFQMDKGNRLKITLPNQFETLDIYDNNTINIIKYEKGIFNPILNKRVLLQSNSKRMHKRFDKKNNGMHVDYESHNKNCEGRVVIMGDSNCIDSANVEKPCLWLLNAFLEYTMNAHTSSLLKGLNNAALYETHVPGGSIPRRSHNSKLHKFSKVIDYNNKLKKRSLEKC